MLQIVQYPHPALLKKCALVTSFDYNLEKLTAEMFEVMESHAGIGLAANQVAINQSIFVMKIDEKEYIFINPQIISTEGEDTLFNEGCLSFPNFGQEISRPGIVHVQWQDIKGRIHQDVFTGIHATCIQHEIDHLNGISFLDHLPPVKKLFAFKKFLKMKKFKNLKNS